MTFHPDKNLPNCMMPDGGECCAGHVAVVDDWHKQRRRIEALEAALREIDELNYAFPLPSCITQRVRAALGKDAGK